MLGRGATLGLLVLVWLPAGLDARPLRGEPARFESLTVPVGSYEISGQVSGVGVGTRVDARLLGPDGAARALDGQPTGLDGSFELRFESRDLPRYQPRRIRPGDRIVLSLSQAEASQALTLTVPPLSSTVDPLSGQVEGFAPVGAQVYLTAFDAAGGFARLQARSDDAGRYSARFEGLTLGPGAFGSALVLQDGGIAFQAAWALPSPRLAIGSAAVGLQVRPGERVLAELSDPEGRAKASAEGYDRGGLPALLLRDAVGAPVPILPGDRLTLRFDAGDPDGFAARAPIVLSLPPLRAELDPDGGRLAGQTAPGEALWIALDQGRVELRADPRYGYFNLPLPEGLAEPLQLGFVRLPGVSVALGRPQVTRRDAGRAWVEGTGTAGAALRLELAAPDSPTILRAEGRVGPDGRFALGLTESGPPRVLGEGDRLSLSIEGYDAGNGRTRWHAIEWRQARLDARADAALDRVVGRAGAGETVEVTVLRQRETRRATADSDGAWRVDFRGLADIRAGDRIEVAVADARSGPPRRLDLRAFRVLPQANGERVLIEGSPGSSASVEVERRGLLLGSGRCRIADDAGRCEALLHDDAGDSLWLAGGDLVVAMSEGLGTAAVDLVPMSAHIDPGGRDVVGIAPAEDVVEIRFANDQGDGLPLDTGAGTDENGVYDHELSASEWEQLVPGLMAEVSYARPRGHAQLARAAIEQLRLTPGRPELALLSEPGTWVTVSLQAGCRAASAEGCAWRTLEQRSARVPGDGRPHLALAGLADPAPLTPRRVLLEHRRGRIELPLVPFLAWRPDASGAVAGRGQPFARLRAFHHLWPAPGRPEWLAVSGAVAHDGRFWLPAPDLDPALVDQVELVMQLGGGAELALTLEPGRELSRVYLPLASRSSSNVTGPSLTSSTAIMAPKRPVSTGRPPRPRQATKCS